MKQDYDVFKNRQGYKLKVCPLAKECVLDVLSCQRYMSEPLSAEEFDAIVFNRITQRIADELEGIQYAISEPCKSIVLIIKEAYAYACYMCKFHTAWKHIYENEAVEWVKID